MIVAIAPLDDVGTWARTDLLEGLLVAVGAVLVGRAVEWVGGRVTAGIDARSRGDDALVRSEATKHRHAVSQVLTWVVRAVVYCVAALTVLARLGVPLSGFVAPAAVVGVALGFGAQRIVADILAGFFLITERQYGFGDLVQLSVAGIVAPRTGTVEDVTLRITSIRTSDGNVVITPNGQIIQVTNLSRDWARAVVDVPLPIAADVARANEVLRRVGTEAFADPALNPLLLDPPTVMGGESLDVGQVNVRVVARTLPGRQFEVGRSLRARIAVALATAGITGVSPGPEIAVETSAGPTGTGSAG